MNAVHLFRKSKSGLSGAILDDLAHLTNGGLHKLHFPQFRVLVIDQMRISTLENYIHKVLNHQIEYSDEIRRIIDYCLESTPYSQFNVDESEPEYIEYALQVNADEVCTLELNVGYEFGNLIISRNMIAN